MKPDYLKWGALVAALVATASAEYELARAVGFNTFVAAAVPGALDLYTVRALRARREVLAAVAAMIGVNAASHLVTAGLVAVNVPLVVAVSAIAPLVLWRVHSLSTGHDEPVSVPDSAPEMTAPVTVKRVADDQPKALPKPPEVVPTGARMLPLVARPEPVEVTTVEPAQVVIPAVPALESGTFWDAHKGSDLYTKLTASVPAVQARQVVTQVITLTPSELRREGRRLHREAVRSTRRPVTIQTLQAELGLSRRDATELRREIVEGRS
ncbi:hypothetical protein [Streptomyces sp. HUAS ZL42]|uniref:hypothetical protein n=1 Tax=Streptomyces sp. HUAS ZL42 TaxID=3231715 RepID=UPI00345E57CA